MMQAFPVITLDGPSGVGKGTVGMRLARYLHWHYLDSGALYRMVAWYAQQQRVASTHDAIDSLLALVAGMDMDFCLDHEGKRCTIKINGEDVTAHIRTESCGQMASKIAVFPELREALLDVQHGCCRAPGLVADGRDMGTAIFPHAAYKFFLDASCEERAKRRYLQLVAAGHEANQDAILADLEVRDQRDRQRKVAPLQAAADAVCLDTTRMGADAVFNSIRQTIAPLFSQ